MPDLKKFSSAISTARKWPEAIKQVANEVRGGIGGDCDLAVIFVTELYEGLAPEALAAELEKTLRCQTVIGCNSSGVIAGSSEVEMEPAIALMGMRLPGVKITPFYLSPQDTLSLDPKKLIETLDTFPTEKPKFLAFADPMTCDIEKWIQLFNGGYPGAPVIGGLASGAAIGKPNWLMLGKEVYGQGSVGLALSGDVEFDVVVAQGCRPIGEPLVITKAKEHVLLELGGRPPVEVLQQVIRGLNSDDQELARHSLFAGLAMNEYRDQFSRGDFLVRNLVGFDPESGSLMVGASLKVGQTLQFQLRDARTSDEDLKALLSQHRAAGTDGSRGALLVSCCGRGKGLYGEPDHDSRLIQKLKGPLPLAGFFANGEIGPVGDRNYIHGYTSSLAVIR